MESNLNKILNGNYSELTDHNIDKKPIYGKVIIEEVPADKIIIVNNDQINIVKGDKIIRVDKDLNIEVVGDVTLKADNITILQDNKDGTQTEGLVSYSKLKIILETALGNFGAPLQFPLGLSEDVLTYDKIKIGK